MRTAFRWQHVVIAGLAIAVPTGSLPAQQGEAKDEAAVSAARLKAMEEHARSIQVTTSDGSNPSPPVPLIPEPILRYDDIPRNIFDSTLWAWGSKGRPVAILKVEDYPSRPAEVRWLYGIVSLAPGLIRVQGDTQWEWSSTQPGLEMRSIPDAPVPAATERLRLGQMKAIARRFESHEDGGTIRGRLQLRLMPRPIHRYADPDRGLQDGVIFCFAYGTNPDLLLVLESSHQPEEAAPSWKYGLARLGGCAIFVSRDGDEVWSQTSANPPARRETYMNRRQRHRGEP